MMDLKITGNYISLEYVARNQVLTQEKKDLYILIIVNETPLGNIR
jgi:hypothetical protein